MSSSPEIFIGCDWGSSSFRLRVIERSTRKVRAEQRSTDGVKVFAGRQPAERAAAMAAFLADRLAVWPQIPPTTPVVVSGMAGSTVGWVDLPYVQVPFPLDGSRCRFGRVTVPAPGGSQREVILVSGLRTDDDIMRGEECALVGAYALQPDCLRSGTETWALLAGTHPKHAFVVEAAVQTFCTHLTGELFDALASTGLLAASIERAAAEEEPDLPSFRAGVASARERGASAALFQVRARDVLHRFPKTANTWFLSGVLIGAELSRLSSEPLKTRLLLIGTPPRVRLYREALRELGTIARVEDLPTIGLDEAMVAGQDVLFDRATKGLAP